MNKKTSKGRKDSSSSSESGSDSENSSGSGPNAKLKDQKRSKDTKLSKASKRDHSSNESDSGDKNTKIKKKENDCSKWDSPEHAENTKKNKYDKHVVDDPKSKRRHSDEEHGSRKESHHEDHDRDSRHSKRRDRDGDRSRQRERDRSYEDRNRDGRHRNENSRSGGSYEDRRQSNYGRRDHSPRDNRRNYNRDKYHDSKRRRSNSTENANYAWGKQDAQSGDQKHQQQNAPKVDKEKPNFGLSGKLTEETNTYRGVVIKYSEPTDARKPKRRWRLYPFKGEKAMQTLYIHRQSAYLIGRDRKIVDLPVDHPSCSKQHAVLQYRLVPFTRDDGSTGKRIRPYIIDLESANGTFINNNKIDPKKYVELLEKDVIKFGFSSREYVMLHENSKDEAQDDDVKQEDEEVVNVKEEKDD